MEHTNMKFMCLVPLATLVQVVTMLMPVVIQIHVDPGQNWIKGIVVRTYKRLRIMGV